jgi:hypothetical protein
MGCAVLQAQAKTATSETLLGWRLKGTSSVRIQPRCRVARPCISDIVRLCYCKQKFISLEQRLRQLYRLLDTTEKNGMRPIDFLIGLLCNKNLNVAKNRCLCQTLGTIASTIVSILTNGLINSDTMTKPIPTYSRPPFPTSRDASDFPFDRVARVVVAPGCRLSHLRNGDPRPITVTKDVEARLAQSSSEAIDPPQVD